MGEVGNVLPHHHNIKYVDYTEGSHFGVLDIIASCVAHGVHVDDWVMNHDKLKREFTVMCQSISELLTLSIRDLETMKDDFADQYDMLFNKAQIRLLRQLQIKCLAIKFYQRHHKNYVTQMHKSIAKNETEQDLDLQKQEQMLHQVIQS